MQPQSQFNQLLQSNRESFVEAFQLNHVPYIQPLLSRVFEMPAQDITHTILNYDHQILERGLGSGSRWLLKKFSTTVMPYHLDSIPKVGPLLVVSNHPGMTDAMAIFATLPRTDIYAVARKNPILSHLPGVQEHVIFVDDNQSINIQAVRKIIDLLQQGKTVITFPAGKIEPDPALRDNAVETLSDWSPSLQLFRRRVPELQVLPVAVGGVISRQALRHPITKFYRQQARRDWVAATLMILIERYRDVTVSVRFGQAIDAASDQIIEAVRAQMHQLIMQTWHDTTISDIVPY